MRTRNHYLNFGCLLLVIIQILLAVTFLTCKPKDRAQNRNQTMTIEQKPYRLLVVAILSKLSAFERREAIRNSWMEVCKSETSEVICVFFTDSLDGQDAKQTAKALQEVDSHNDVLFMPYKGGHNFGVSLVWMMSWFANRYKFDFFLRIDDDYFLCLERLLLELPHRPKVGLYWGYLHCRKNVVRIDEGFMILTADIIHEALDKLNTTLPCHPFGDQAVALWVKDSKINITYFADPRVRHSATGYGREKYLQSSICANFIGLHGAYPNTMLKYWIFHQKEVSGRRKLTESAKNDSQPYFIPSIQPYKHVCEYDQNFDLNFFWPHVRFAAKPCKDNPVWRISGQEFASREKTGEQIY